jgi:hypothetical protein
MVPEIVWSWLLPAGGPGKSRLVPDAREHLADRKIDPFTAVSEILKGSGL